MALNIKERKESDPIFKTTSHFSSRLFTKLVLEAPIITESALEVIRRYCEDEVGDMTRTQLLVLGLVPCMSTQVFVVTFVSVSGVFGHDDSEGAYRQTALEAVSVSACASGSQLT